ncbi:cytochrome P450 [Parasphingorhabdus flavimaris]|uniref:cytochrome P450 n=1 Tax=Parasphingorhabdus flavimaris TaxID=266812 RepID=UPI0030031400
MQVAREKSSFDVEAHCAETATHPNFPIEVFRHPTSWPRLDKWLPTARQNALALFPDKVLHEPCSWHSLLGKRLLILSDGDLATQFLKRPSKKAGLSNLHKRILSPAMGDGIIVNDGPEWKTLRRAGLKAASHLKDRTNGRENSILQKHIDEWSIAEEFNLLDRIVPLSIHLLAHRLFGFDGDLPASMILHAIDQHRKIAEDYGFLDAVDAPQWITSDRTTRAKMALAPIRDFIETEISEAQLKNQQLFSQEITVDFIINMMSGYESVAITSTWLLAHIGNEPSLKRWLMAPNISEDEFKDRLTKAIKETLRLYPPLPFIFRKAKENIKLGGFVIGKGTTVCVSPYLIHHNTLNWSEASSFDPSRFERSDNNYSCFLPYGVGARKCIGQNIGNELIFQLVKSVLRNGDLKLSKSDLPKPRAGISLRPSEPIYTKYLANAGE